MAFEVYIPGSGGKRTVQSKGVVYISKRGEARFYKTDLVKVGITESVVVMVDNTILRIGIRTPKLGEEGITLIVQDYNTLFARVIMKTVLKKGLKLDPGKVAGEYDLIFPERAGWLEFSLNPGEVAEFDD